MVKTTTLGDFIMKPSKNLSDKSYSKEAKAFTNAANGTMNYLEKQSGFASKDAGKLKRGAYKENRYK